MNIWVILTVALTAFYLNCVEVVQGIDCYKCHYIEGMSQEELEGDHFDFEKDMWDETCKLGNTPNSKFLGSCSAGYSCSKMSFSGKHPTTDKDIAVSLRVCLDPVEKVKGQCKDMTIPELVKDPDWNSDDIFGEDLDNLNKIMNLSESRANICYCDSDKCNTAASLVSTSQTVAISILSFFFAGNFL